MILSVSRSAISSCCRIAALGTWREPESAPNLLAHHLQVLSRARLVETVRSTGDGRRRYVQLRPRDVRAAGGAACARLHASIRSVRLLVELRALSARSRALASPLGRASRVGRNAPGETRPPGCAPRSPRHGLDLSDAVSQNYRQLAEEPDLVVPVCDQANEELRAAPGVVRLHGSPPDPVAIGDRRAFEQTIDALRERIDLLVRFGPVTSIEEGHDAGT